MNGKKKKTSLIFNLIILIGVNILALTLVQVTVLSKAAKDNSRQDHVESYVLLTKTIQMNMENILEGYFKELDAYANADIMREGNFDKAGRWLQNHPEIRGKDFDYIMLIGKDGISYNDNGTRTDVSTRDYVKAIMQNGQKRFVDNPVVSKTTGKRVIHITRSVYDENGNLFAALAGVINVDILVQPIKNLKVPDGIWVFLIDHSGTVIYHPFATEGGNFISNPGEGHEDLSEVSKRMVDGEEGHSWIVSYTGSKQDLIVYSGIAGTPWGLGFLVPGKLVDALGSKISKTALAFGLGMVVATILLGGFILSKSLKPLNIVKNAITGIAHGNADLTQRININSQNEIGQVVQGFNQFAEKMQEIIRDVKYSKSELAEAGEDMTASTQDTSSAITQILSNIDQVGDQINSQAAGVEETAGAVNEIASNIESLERMIENQSSGVAQASAAVEQMIGNIQSVNGSVDKMADSFQDLKANAQHGFSKQQDVNERIQQIEQQSSMLQEANAAISAIAEQTNLLAMNAAIEAAHAGDAGKGFAVVADEIRKLSETSTVQSKTIGDQLSNIQESIMGVVTASSESSKAFEAVSGQLTATDELVIMIKSAMEEQNEGSKQISEALKSMNNSTVEVRNASQEMAEGNKAILVEMKNLQDSALVMKDSMAQMSAGARKINDTGIALTGVAEKIQTSIEKIGYQIDQFKV